VCCQHVWNGATKSVLLVRGFCKKQYLLGLRNSTKAGLSKLPARVTRVLRVLRWSQQLAPIAAAATVTTSAATTRSSFRVFLFCCCTVEQQPGTMSASQTELPHNQLQAIAFHLYSKCSDQTEAFQECVKTSAKPSQECTEQYKAISACAKEL
jgi:hypothetical protein